MSLFELFTINKSKLKIFLIPFFIVFIGASLKQLGIQPLHLILPIESKEIDSMASITPLLQKKENTYGLQKQSGFIGESHAAEGADYEEAKAYAVVDFDSGKVVLEKNLSEPLPIASLTKIMTSVVSLDLGSPDEIITVSQRAEEQVPTHIALKEGQQLTLKELLYAALLTSANDAAQAIKDGMDAKYGDDIFIRSMNTKAKFIGLHHTHFANPQGFDDDGNYSSVEDLAILSHYALKNYPVFSDLVALDSYVLPETSTHDAAYLNNWNGLLGVYPHVSGVKIGNTGAAKKTTVVVSERGGKKMLVVLLGAPGIIERDLWAAQLLDAGFEKEYGLDPVNITETDLRAKYATWKY